MKLGDYRLRLGALVLMPSGGRAVLVELGKRTMCLRYMESDEVVEHARRFVEQLPVCGYLPRALLNALLPLECEALAERGGEMAFSLAPEAGGHWLTTVAA